MQALTPEAIQLFHEIMQSFCTFFLTKEEPTRRSIINGILILNGTKEGDKEKAESMMLSHLTSMSNQMINIEHIRILLQNGLDEFALLGTQNVKRTIRFATYSRKAPIEKIHPDTIARLTRKGTAAYLLSGIENVLAFKSYATRWQELYVQRKIFQE